MSNSQTKVWIHAILNVKGRELQLKGDSGLRLFSHLESKLKEYGCHPGFINGGGDHVHLLFTLPPSKPIEGLMKQIKVESSHFINKQGLTDQRFSWSAGYGAFSVSESRVEMVKEYILRQDDYHSRWTFSQEYTQFLVKHGLLDRKKSA